MAVIETCERLLKSFNMRSTPSRQEILGLFLEREYALSHGDIEKEVSHSLDRVTVYRTIRTFLDRGVIHKVLDDEGTLKYALCSEACSSTGHHHDHIHFKCTSCGQTLCLDMELPGFHLPRGYKPDTINVLVQGTCEKCNGVT